MMRVAPWLGVLFLLAARPVDPPSGGHRVRRRAHVARVAGRHPRRQDDGHRSRSAAPSRTVRTWSLGKHNVRASRRSREKIAHALGNALVAPVVAYVPEGSIDPPTAHMRFPGTITVPDAAFEQVLESAARSFRLHGFRDIVLHRRPRRLPEEPDGGRRPAQPRVGGVRRARVTRSSSTTGRAETAYRAALKSRGYQRRRDRHACRARRHVARAGDRSRPRPPRQARCRRARTAADGVTGDPRRAVGRARSTGRRRDRRRNRRCDPVPRRR